MSEENQRFPALPYADLKYLFFRNYSAKLKEGLELDDYMKTA